jgi:hypothetical protein
VFSVPRRPAINPVRLTARSCRRRRFPRPEFCLAAPDSPVDEADSGTGGTIAISVIAGTAGVGKTALAFLWAHSAARGFADGQLYANLRGYDQSGIPASADEIMRGFLHAMQVDYMRLPATFDEQAAMY